MRSGRALLYPIYKSTHERGDVIANDYPSTTAVWRDHMVMWSKDSAGRSTTCRAGPTSTGTSATSASAGEPAWRRCSWRSNPGQIALLVVGGFYLQPALPEADPVNFAPRVTMPVLMLNGRFDFFFPTETSQEPMFGSSARRPSTSAGSCTSRRTPCRAPR